MFETLIASQAWQCMAGIPADHMYSDPHNRRSLASALRLIRKQNRDDARYLRNQLTVALAMGI